MIKTLLVAHRDRARLREILGIASRFGLGILLSRLGLEPSSNQAEEPQDVQSLPRRTRLALEALGPTFVKLGQILATREDLLDPAWIAELQQLHSQAPTLPFDTLRSAVEQALGQAPETAFGTFDMLPLAAASMAQVHRATLEDGRPVVLKIRRPDIRPRIEADLRLIAQLAAVAETASAEIRRFAPAALLRQLTEALLEELDFTSEGRNADRLRADFAHDSRVVIPEIHWEWTSETLLVMDYVDGIAPRNGDKLREAGIDPAAIASLGSEVVLDMLLVNGRFHGDPHPGNLLCMPGNRLALLDFGMIGHVSPRRREEFIDFVQALSSGDPARLADTLMLWTAGSGVGRDRVQIAAERLIIRHGAGKIVLSAMVGDFLSLIRDEGMTMPTDLLLIFKALVTVDGVLMGIEPNFDLSQAMRLSLVRIAAHRASPAHRGPNVQALAWEFAKISDDAPRLLRAAIRRLEQGKEDVATSLNGTVDHSDSRWTAFAIVLAGAMIAAAIFLK